MDRLKAILADKILDLTSLGGDDVKIKIDRMQRFRDFANACQTLMNKYPQIEDELIKMVQDGDFDTKVASSRVDSVIRLADQNKIITDNVPEPIIPESVTESIEQEEAPQYLPEDIDYEEVVTDNGSSKEYASYTDIDDSSQSDGDSITVDNDVLQPSAVENLNLSEEEQASIKRKATIRKVMQIIGIILAVIILIIIIKFVIKHWVVILSIVGGLAIIAIIVWFVKNKKS